MTAREELAAVLADYLRLYGLPANYWAPIGDQTHADVAKRIADLATERLLASPALASLIREKRFEEVKASNLRAIQHEVNTPPRAHTATCCAGVVRADQTEEPT